MNHVTNEACELLSDELGEFFAPTSADMVDALIGQYQAMKRKIEETIELVLGDERGAAIGYCLDGNLPDMSRYGGHSIERIFRAEGAIKALNADYWQRALQLTDVIELMPADRRHEWHEQIRNHDTPDFEEATVRATLESLLAQRAAFFAERVDGVFRALSPFHKTNKTTGFSKRMIVQYMLGDYGSPNSCTAGYLNDLRAVIARFMHRDEPSHGTSYYDLCRLNERLGVWQPLDGNALRVRLYKNGNCHIEVAPDIAWRLNRVLAALHPEAIPSELREPPRSSARLKDFQLMETPLPFSVLSALRDCRPNDNWTTLRVSIQDKHVRQEIERVLSALGGAQVSPREFAFDYPVKAVIDQVMLTGTIPEQRSHQFYPTPEALAQRAIEAAEIGDHHTVLEPSAGQGGIARFLPADRTTCVEVAPLHCRALESQGLQAVNADFLEWAKDAPSFDRIVMNPPYHGGRHQAHLEAAAGLLAPGGKLVAILPATVSSRPSRALSDWEVSLSSPYTGHFKGTGISVVILTATKPAQSQKEAA